MPYAILESPSKESPLGWGGPYKGYVAAINMGVRVYTYTYTHINVLMCLFVCLFICLGSFLLGYSSGGYDLRGMTQESVIGGKLLDAGLASLVSKIGSKNEY